MAALDLHDGTPPAAKRTGRRNREGQSTLNGVHPTLDANPSWQLSSGQEQWIPEFQGDIRCDVAGA